MTRLRSQKELIRLRKQIIHKALPLLIRTIPSNSSNARLVSALSDSLTSPQTNCWNIVRSYKSCATDAYVSSKRRETRIGSEKDWRLEASSAMECSRLPRPRQALSTPKHRRLSARTLSGPRMASLRQCPQWTKPFRSRPWLSTRLRVPRSKSSSMTRDCSPLHRLSS